MTETLYAIDEAVVMLPYANIGPNRSKARYEGWRALHDVGMVEEAFAPVRTSAHVRWMYRYTADPFAELTHRYGDPMTPGAFKVWRVEVEPWHSPGRLAGGAEQ